LTGQVQPATDQTNCRGHSGARSDQCRIASREVQWLTLQAPPSSYVLASCSSRSRKPRLQVGAASRWHRPRPAGTGGGRKRKFYETGMRAGCRRGPKDAQFKIRVESHERPSYMVVWRRDQDRCTRVGEQRNTCRLFLSDLSLCCSQSTIQLPGLVINPARAPQASVAFFIVPRLARTGCCDAKSSSAGQNPPSHRRSSAALPRDFCLTTSLFSIDGSSSDPFRTT
jgi:hypothetical protein